ncbi:MAG TPA: hypothetical protein VKD90_18155 [Gemmataceae bacterium]|nr:hypothetical protein [Gemmataceae bacterium]
MGTHIVRALVLLALPAALAAQDAPPAKRADGEPPLPPGAVMRLGDTRFRPGARIRHLAFSPDGSRLASWGNWMYFGDRLSVWDTATGREVFTRVMPEGGLADLAWGRDGGFAVISGPGGSRVWAFADAGGKYAPDDAGLPQPAPGPMVVAGPIGPAVAAGRMALSADGGRLAVVPTGGGSVQVLPTKAGASVTDLKPVTSTDRIPSGTCTALHFARGTQAVVVLTQTATGQSAVVWDIEKNTVSDPVAVPLGVQQGALQSLDVADDGSALAVGMTDGTVQVFDLPSGKERLSVKKHDGPKHGGRWSEVSAVKFVNGGRNVLSAGRDNRQLVWDARTGADMADLNGHGSWVEAVAVSADGKRVATAGQDSLVRLWEPATWKPILAPKGPRETIWRLEVSRDGRYAAAGSGDGAHVWNLQTGGEVRAVTSDYRSGHVLFSPDGGLLTGDGKGALTLFPVPTGEAKRLAAKGRLLDFTPDGKTLLTAEGSSVDLWDWPSGTKLRTIPVKGEALSAAVSPDSRTAVMGLSGKPAVVIDLESGSVRDLSAKLHWFARAAGFLAGGKVACGTVGSAQAEAWVVGTGARVRQFEQPPARPRGHFYQLGLAVSPDGRRAASSHSDGGLAVYETATGQVLAHFEGHRDSVISIAWAGGDRVLSAGGDHQVLVWDASIQALAGKVAPLPAADRAAAWERLGSQAAKEALKVMAALVADPDGAVTLIGERLKPVAAADPAALDRIFRDLDAASFAAREKASRELAELGVGAVAGARERVAKAQSAEVRGRAEAFLKKFAAEDLTPDRVRYLRALDVLAAADTPAARQLVERLAGGAAEVWETEAARQALRSLPARPTAK